MPENNQTTLYALSAGKAELHIKDMKWVVRGGEKIANIGTYILWSCRIVHLGHPKFTCQTQSISASHISRTWARANKTFEFLSKHKWKQKEEKRLLKKHLRTILMETIHEFQVTCQQTQVSHVSNTRAPTKEELHIKSMKRVEKGGQINANIGTYALQSCRSVRW